MSEQLIKLEIDSKEFDKAIEKLYKVLSYFSRKERLALLRKSGKPILEAAKNNIDDNAKPVKRYNTPKVIGKLRAPKGAGVVDATYHPGNLRKSIKMLTFRSSSDIFVGPKIRKKDFKGDFGLSATRVDGYYAHMVEFGALYSDASPFMMPAYRSKNREVINKIIQGVEKAIIDYKKKNSV